MNTKMTTPIDVTMSLGDLVTAHPELARQFERHCLDYCCGGRVPFRDACAEAGLDAWSLAIELGESLCEPEAAEWASLGAVALVDHLERLHHRYLWDEMPRITALMGKVLAAHGERHPELHAIAACWSELRADLAPHLQKEEHVLFPMIRALAAARTSPTFHCGSLRNPISVMWTEHEAVGTLLARMRQLTRHYQVPSDGCASYMALFDSLAELEADTHLHVHKENNVLFPEVVRMEAELQLG